MLGSSDKKVSCYKFFFLLGKGVGGGPDKTEQLDSRRMQQPKLADDLFQSVSDEDDLFSTKTSDKFMKTSESKALLRENDKIRFVAALRL